MKAGYYLKFTKDWIRCYYLSGEKAGNKWISIREYEDVPNPEWWALNWMCLPNEEELLEYDYFLKNPTKYERV